MANKLTSINGLEWKQLLNELVGTSRQELVYHCNRGNEEHVQQCGQAKTVKQPRAPYLPGELLRLSAAGTSFPQ